MVSFCSGWYCYEHPVGGRSLVTFDGGMARNTVVGSGHILLAVGGPLRLRIAVTKVYLNSKGTSNACRAKSVLDANKIELCVGCDIEAERSGAAWISIITKVTLTLVTRIKGRIS